MALRETSGTPDSRRLLEAVPAGRSYETLRLPDASIDVAFSDDDVSGLIVDMGDVADAARRLCEAMRAPATTARVGRAAQDKFAADFNVDRLMTERLQHWAALRRNRLADKVA